jgi:hypothetical protein
LILLTPRTKKATIVDASFAIVGECQAFVTVAKISVKTSLVGFPITDTVLLRGAFIIFRDIARKIILGLDYNVWGNHQKEEGKLREPHYFWLNSKEDLVS